MPESRRRKLEMLTRAIAKGDIGAAAEMLRTPPVAPKAPQQPLTLAQACPGTVVSLRAAGGELPYWLIRKTLREVDAESLAGRNFAAVMRGARQRFDELTASAALCKASVAQPEELLFMDIESCGLYGASVFLVGMMFWEKGDLVFEQHLARDYTEEAAILHAFVRRHEACSLLVTFNGKSFDMNMLRDRSAFHRVGFLEGRECPPHLDLLHESRRRWRGKLPNCRLQTLEECLCGRRRVGDIPGWAIPDAYHRFVDSADARQLADILHHNLLDLLTMAELLTLLLTNCDV
jgi:uncharacterized protein YprB with RNaseH-like and TPR domain